MLHAPCLVHDFMLAKEIIAELEKIAAEKKIGKIKKVYLEIGSVSLAHDGMPEHTDEISLENLKFALKSLAKSPVLAGTDFEIKKIPGENWQITEIEA